MFVRAKAGLKIRDPLTKLLIPDEGCEVVESAFWHRIINDGDVEIVVKSEAPKEKNK